MARTRSFDETQLLTDVHTVIRGTNSGTVQLYAKGHYWLPGEDTYDWYSTYNHPKGKVGRKGTITDVIAPGSYNPVTHVSETWECPLRTVESAGTLDADTRLSCNCTITMGAADASEWAKDSWPVMASDSLMVAEATTSMSPGRIQGSRFNVPQFVGELREARDSLGSACVSLTALLRFLDRWGAFALGGLTLKESVDHAVKADLARKFAVQPMIADVKSAIQSFGGLLKLFDKLKNGSPFRAYGSSRRSSNNSWNFSGYPYTRFAWGNTQTFTKLVTTWAMVRYTNPIAGILNSDMEGAMNSLFTRYQVLLGYYRFNAPVRTAWELCPLSFLVDWVIDYGTWLDRFDFKNIEFPFEVIASGYSVKKTVDNHGYVNPHDGTDNARLQDVTKAGLVTGRFVKSTYSRVIATLPWEDHQWAPPRVRLPDFGKLGTLLELITTWSGMLSR